MVLFTDYSSALVSLRPLQLLAASVRETLQRYGITLSLLNFFGHGAIY